MKKVVLVSGALGLATLSLAACSSSPQASSVTTTTKPSKIKQNEASMISSTSVMINGKSVAVPREEYFPDRPIEPFQDNGTYVIMTAKGLLPQRLNAPAAPVTITWFNLGSQTITVNFAFLGVPATEKIAPGATFSHLMNNDGNISYVTSTGYNGSVDVGELPLPPITGN